MIAEPLWIPDATESPESLPSTYRDALYAWAEAHDFPRLKLRPWASVLAGSDGWRLFVNGPTATERQWAMEAIAALETVDEQEEEEKVSNVVQMHPEPEEQQEETPEPAPEPKLRTISHSQIELWEQCARKFYLERVVRMPKAPASALIYGDAIHQALAADGEAIKSGQPAHSVGGLESRFAFALDERLQRDDPDGLLAAEVPTWKLKARAVFAGYVEKVQPHYHPIAVERSISVSIPDLPGWKYIGIIDGLTERGGLLTIVDWKTGKPWRSGEEHKREQATAYTWLFQRANREEGWGLRETPDRVTFISLPATQGEVEDGDGTYICVPDFRPTTRTPQEIANYPVHVADVARDIEASEAHGETAFMPCVGNLCKWCAYSEECPEGQEHMASRRETPMVPLSSVMKVKKGA